APPQLLLEVGHQQSLTPSCPGPGRRFERRGRTKRALGSLGRVDFRTRVWLCGGGGRARLWLGAETRLLLLASTQPVSWAGLFSCGRSGGRRLPQFLMVPH